MKKPLDLLPDNYTAKLRYQTKLQGLLESVLPVEFADKASFAGLNQRTAIVIVPSATISTTLKFHEFDIVKTLNQTLKYKINGVQFKVNPDYKTLINVNRPIIERTLSEKTRALLKGTSSHIKDTDLKASLERLAKIKS